MPPKSSAMTGRDQPLVECVAPCQHMCAMKQAALDEPDRRGDPGFLTLDKMALAVLNSDSRAAKARIVRIADRGELAVIRIGTRRDRLFPASEVERLHSVWKSAASVMTMLGRWRRPGRWNC